MPTELQNFDLYDMGSETAADMHGGLDTVPTIIRRVVQANDNLALDSHRDREALISALTIALANQRQV